MNGIIFKHLDKSNKRNVATAEILQGMILSNNVSSTKCANYITGDAKKDSKIKRVERFYARNYLNEDMAVQFLHSCMGSKKNILSLDRTNWEYGDKDINALVLYGVNDTTSSMLNIDLLDNNGGNSNFNDRKQVLQPVIDKLGSDNISALLCDREFFSFEFVHYLVEENIPFVIRIKKNLNFIQPLINSLGNTSKTLRDQVVGTFNGKEIRLDLSAKKLKDEYLLTVSFRVANPLKQYRMRWSIECFFKSIKTAGLNVENTHITRHDRLRSLFLLCGMAYAICKIMGILRHQYVEKIKFKNTLQCFQFSFFRYGLDWITELIFVKAIKPEKPNYTAFPQCLTVSVR